MPDRAVHAPASVTWLSKPVLAFNAAHSWRTPSAVHHPPDAQRSVGDFVGIGDGLVLGTALGDTDGDQEGEALGNVVGDALGPELGETDGEALGDVDGEALGLSLGTAVGDVLGLAEGLELGDTLGIADGDSLGLDEGLEVGAAVGVQASAAADFPTAPTIPARPDGHASHPLAPSVPWYHPCGQSTHSRWPSATLYVPATHAVHDVCAALAAPVGPTLPAGHGAPRHVRSLEHPALCWPDGHAAHVLQKHHAYSLRANRPHQDAPLAHAM